jgi:hypothetical protein
VAQDLDREIDTLTLNSETEYATQDQNAVPEGRCGFEMLAGDVSLGPLSPDTLSEAVEENRSAVCWRQTAYRGDRCGWHANQVVIDNSKNLQNVQLFLMVLT